MRREWNIPAGGVVIGAAGRMVEEKNFALLIQAWKQADFKPGTRLVLVGDGPERAALQQAAQGHPDILFTGYRTDMPDLLAALTSGLQRLEEAVPRQWDMSCYRIAAAASKVEAFYRRYC